MMTAKGKLIRNIILAVLVLALLGGGYYFALRWEPKPEEIPEETKETVYVIAEQIKDLASVHIKNPDAEYEIVLIGEADGTVTYSLPANAGKETEAAKLQSAVAALIRLPAVNTVAKDGAAAAEFGLDAPKSCYTLQKKDGSSVTVLVGDRVPTGDEFYCMVEGGDSIHTIGGYKAEIVLAVPDDYRSTSILKISDIAQVQGLTLFKNGTPVMTVRAATAEEQQGQVMTGSGAWRFTYPWEEDVDPESFVAVLENLLVVEAIGFGTEDVAPVFDYTLRLSTRDAEYTLDIGGEAPEGGVYLRHRDNLYLVDASVREAVAAMNPNDYLIKLVALAYLDELSGVVVHYGDREYTMEPGDDQGKPYVICGAEVTADSFKKSFQTVIGVLYTERTDVSVSGASALTVTYTYKDGRQENVRYYPYDERHMVAHRPNGSTVKVLQSEFKKLTELIMN